MRGKSASKRHHAKNKRCGGMPDSVESVYREMHVGGSSGVVPDLPDRTLITMFCHYR